MVIKGLQQKQFITISHSVILTMIWIIPIVSYISAEFEWYFMYDRSLGSDEQTRKQYVAFSCEQKLESNDTEKLGDKKNV